MPFYLIQYSYTPESWRALTRGTTERNRHKAVEPLLHQCGGRFPLLTFAGDPPIVLDDKLFAFGASDVVAIVYFPDNERAGAFAMAVLAGGGVKSFQTTPLLTLEEAMRCMILAGEASASSKYAAPNYPPQP
jgi:uncharacterized protein with GYD domain